MKLSISSDQPIAGALLEEIAGLCTDHGARWHQQLKLEVQNGSMRILAPPRCDGVMISLPTSLLVPIAGAEWSESPDVIQLQRPPKATTEVQRKLLQLIVDLYNATNKLHWFNTQHPRSLMKTSAAIKAAVEELKPGYHNKDERISAEQFLATRSYGWQLGADPARRQPVLMPLIDLLNNHHQGSPIRISDGAMHIKAAQPLGSECFANYGGRRDALDLALHYGHFDPSTPFAHCAPLEVIVEGIGRLRMEHQLWRLPKHPADPPRISRDEEGLRISHLCCHQFHPARARLMLKLGLQGTLQQHGYGASDAAKLSKLGANALFVANLKLLAQLIDVTHSSAHPGATVLAAAAKHQERIIAAAVEV